MPDMSVGAVSPPTTVTTGHLDKVFQLIPVISAASYSAGDCVGGLQVINVATRDAGLGALLESIVLIDAAAQSADLIFVFFKNEPNAAGLIDATPAVIDAADYNKIIATHAITSAEYSNVGAVSVASVGSIAKMLTSGDQPDLFLTIIAVGTPTYGSSSDLIINLGLMQS